jgi:hypothetical protein
MTCSTKWAAVAAMRRAPEEGRNPRRLTGEGHQLLMGTLGTAQAQKTVSEYAALEKGIEFVLDKVR